MKQEIKTLQIIHLAICAGIIVAYIFAGNITSDNLKFQNLDSQTLIWILLPFVAVIASKFMFKTTLKQIDPKLPLEKNFPIYQTASIIRYAILEGTAFVVLFVKPEIIIFGILLIVYLVFLRPTEDKFTTDLQDIL